MYFWGFISLLRLVTTQDDLLFSQGNLWPFTGLRIRQFGRRYFCKLTKNPYKLVIATNLVAVNWTYFTFAKITDLYLHNDCMLVL